MSNRIDKYQLGQTLGEGNFAKVRLAVNTINRQNVAIKIIDKQMVMKDGLLLQVEQEIKVMRLLNHPNIVRIHEVIGTKSKIYIVMEYVSNGRLLEKLSYLKLKETSARKLFQQLIDAISYCHSKGVYHRDLKAENLLLDKEGNLKVCDFGLSILKKPGTLLSTICGSPSYVAPELLANKTYDGAAADIWSCGVILFQFLAGSLPFDDSNLARLYRQISRADYKFPDWFTEDQKKLISNILEPSPIKRTTVAEIVEDQWFQINYKPVLHKEDDDNTITNDIDTAFHMIKETEAEVEVSKAECYVNAFQLISMSLDLDLSGLFADQDYEKQKTLLGSENTLSGTIQKIEAAAIDASLFIEKVSSSKVKVHLRNTVNRFSRSCFHLTIEVVELAPKHSVVQITKLAGDLKMFEDFCRNLSNMLKEEQ